MAKSKSSPDKEKKSSGKKGFSFPANLLSPISDLLKAQISKLENRKTKLGKEDPFMDGNRTIDNAAIDAEAAEQFGHARIEAISREIDRKIKQMRQALARMNIGKYGICENCGKMIDTDRLMIYPEATLCVSCEKKREK